MFQPRNKNMILFKFMLRIYSIPSALLILNLVHSDLLSLVERQNTRIYNSLKSISEKDDFSKIKMNFNEKCPRKVDKCALDSCVVQQMSFKGEDGYIDLLKTRESYSKNTKGSNLVWQDLYKVASKYKEFPQILSGLQFSISTHISAFYVKLFGFFISNPRLFQERYRKEYKDNFIHLYLIIRQAVINLSKNSETIDPDVHKLSLLMKFDNELETLMKSDDEYKAVIESIENIKSMDSDEIFTATNDMVKCLACLTCQKCRLWGSIQLKGLRAAFKSLLGAAVYKQDVVFLINLFRRLSVSVEESRRLQSISMPYLWYFGIYYYQLLIFTVLILSIAIYALKKRRIRKEKIL